MSISLEILSALAEQPDGEAPISELRGRLVEAASSPARLARLMSEARANLLVSHRPRTVRSVDLFSNRLVERPRPGVWRITAEGREYLSRAR
jgi:hypothetical protein